MKYAWKETLALYRFTWDNLNPFGKLVMFPWFLLIAPMFFLVALSFKEED